MINKTFYQPKEIWTAESNLRAYAIDIRKQYWYMATFREKHEVKTYAEEIHDWEIWLNVAATLLGQIVNPGEYLNQILRGNRDIHFPLPSELLADRYMAEYSKWYQKQIEHFPTYELIGELKQETKKIALDCSSTVNDWERLRGEKLPSDPVEQKVLGFRYHWRSSQRVGSTDLAEYFYVHKVKIAHKVCDADMFGKAVMRFYPYRKVYTNLNGKNSFLNHFEPVARKAYLQLCDFSEVDLSRLEMDLERSVPSLA